MNVQNIPKEDTVVKRAFVPKLDALLSCDYPNIELKLLAFYLEAIGHPSMAEVFRAGADLHTETAAGIYGIPPEKVTKSQRQTGKRLNFSIVYGGGVNTLISQGVATDAKDALDLLRRYHGTWPGIGWESKRREADAGTLIWHIKNRVNTRGYITTLWGRHLHPRSMHSALNALCQGCAADLIKWACVRVHRQLREWGMRSHIVNVIHDDMLLDCDRYELPRLADAVPDLMTYAPLEACVPIRPEPEVSFKSWADMEPYEQEAA